MWVKILVICHCYLLPSGLTWAYNHQNYPNVNIRNDHYRNDDNTAAAAVGTNYIYKHFQHGSASIPNNGETVLISPNRSLEFVAKIDTTVISPSSSRYAQHHAMTRGRTQVITRSAINGFGAHGRAVPSRCFRCPGEKTVVVPKKRLDVATIDLPPVLNCHNQVMSALYELQTLSFQRSNILLTPGVHTFYGQIVNIKTGHTEHLCPLKYRVVVRQCAKYQASRRGVRVKCDLGQMWGSRCTFACKDGRIASHTASIYCADNLEWTGGEEPVCYAATTSSNSVDKSCDLPLPPPSHGKFSCDTTNTAPTFDADVAVGSGTICRIKCNRHFEMPGYLEKLSTFHCQNGHWNSTVEATDFCVRTPPRKRTVY